MKGKAKGGFLIPEKKSHINTTSFNENPYLQAFFTTSLLHQPLFSYFHKQMANRLLHIILLITLLTMPGYGQNTIGLPDVVNYYKGTYNAGLQNWDIGQDNNGIIYFANNEGLLSFDGRYWELYPLPNKTIVRSVEIGPDNRIYVGGQDELGYFSPASNGRLTYHSLVGKIPASSRSFGDVWDIVNADGAIFFRTPSKIFQFINESAAVFPAPGEWAFMDFCHGRLYAHDYSVGLMIFQDGLWKPLFDKNPLPPNDPVTAILPAPGQEAIITTLKNGLFRLGQSGINRIASVNHARFCEDRIYAATSINEEWIALATTNRGVYITDHQGNIVQGFSKTEQLQNNNVLSIFLDRQQNVWLGLDNGIDFIAYNSPIKHINPLLMDGSGYTAIIHHNHLYTGTSSGLFEVPLQPLKDLSFSKGDFTSIKGAQGQVWNLSEINGQLLMGHHDGAFVIQDQTASQLSPQPGFWNFIPMSSTLPINRVVSGHYKGLTFFSYLGNRFIPDGEVPGFIESSRFVEMDSYENIWISHPYHGIYRISKTNDGRYQTNMYSNKNGLPATLNNHIYKIKNEVLAATEKGVYEYDRDKDIFKPSEFYKTYLGVQGIRYLREDTSGNIWFIHDKNLGVLDMSEKTPRVIYLPELNDKMLSGFEFIYPVDENNVFLGGEKGFYHINYAKYKQTVPSLSVQIRSVRISDGRDSVLFGGYFHNVNEKLVQDKKDIPRIPYSWKTIHFEYSSSLFGYQANLEYSYRLTGFDDSWSEWTKRTEKEYTNLPSGHYSFEVKMRNNLGNESMIASYSFKVLAPWYQSGMAVACYILMALLAIILIYRWQHRKFLYQQTRFEEEQKKVMYIHELELNKTESELVALRNEKLEAEIGYKNSELASSAMHLVKKGELLAKIKEELTLVMKRLDNEQAIGELKKMIKSLNEDENIDQEWENFTKHFDSVNSDFVVRLKEKYPTISSNEIKLCAYLRMNLSTKEIAQLMNISVRGVEISRYRLRKKLGIPTEVNLFDFLIGFTNA